MGNTVSCAGNREGENLRTSSSASAKKNTHFAVCFGIGKTNADVSFIELSPEEELKNAEKRVLEGKTYFWIRDTMPVCMAAQARPTANGIAINGVFTPAEHRCRGYASALVAAVSQMSLDSGKKFCTLYTDLDNPTSNSIYQKIGYKPVGDSTVYRFEYQDLR
jgi:predicted GNAT family acetyltransferase